MTDVMGGADPVEPVAAPEPTPAPEAPVATPEPAAPVEAPTAPSGGTVADVEHEAEKVLSEVEKAAKDAADKMVNLRADVQRLLDALGHNATVKEIVAFCEDIVAKYK